jgi:hypothetical protein
MAMHSASPDLFVVRSASDKRNTAAQRLAPIGTVEPLAKDHELAVLHVGGMPQKVDPRETWRRASQLLGSLGTVDPVLVGPDGSCISRPVK